jgi:hypothetical protein
MCIHDLSQLSRKKNDTQTLEVWWKFQKCDNLQVII